MPPSCPGAHGPSTAARAGAPSQSCPPVPLPPVSPPPAVPALQGAGWAGGHRCRTLGSLFKGYCPVPQAWWASCCGTGLTVRERRRGQGPPRPTRLPHRQLWLGQHPVGPLWVPHRWAVYTCRVSGAQGSGNTCHRRPSQPDATAGMDHFPPLLPCCEGLLPAWPYPGPLTQVSHPGCLRAPEQGWGRSDTEDRTWAWASGAEPA